MTEYSRSCLERLSKLDMKNLSQQDIDWLHKLKNLAMAVQGRIQLLEMKERLIQKEENV